MRTEIYIENQIDPPCPEDIEQHQTELLCFKNCIFNQEPVLDYESVSMIHFEACIFNESMLLNYRYRAKIHFENCLFVKSTSFTGALFFRGFTIEKSIFLEDNYEPPESRFTLIEALSGNGGTLEIKDNIFHDFVYFEDNYPDAPLIVKNNVFLDGTNLLEGAHLSLEVRDVDCIEGNHGVLDMNFDEKVKNSKKP